MKNYAVYFMFAFLFVFNSFSNSQEALKKGVYSLSGGISFSASKNSMGDEYYKQNQISFSPSISYFVVDNLLLGANISFIYYENIAKLSFNDFEYKSIGRDYLIGPSLKYFFNGYKIVPFVGVSAYYTSSIGSEQEGKNISASLGIDYFITKSIAVEPFLQYSYTFYNKPDQDINTFSIGLRMNYFIIK